MARPYFTGNYGSPLMSNQAAAMLVADQGAKEGQMFANMGAQVGGVIKQYGLNKEKRRMEEDTAMGTLAGFLPEELMQIGQDNPKLGKAIERAMGENATPRDFQLINASAAPIVAGKMRQLQTDATSALTKSRDLANEFAEETRNLRADIVGQQRDFGEIRNKLQSLNLDKVEQLQPDEIKATLARVKSIIDTMPSLTASTIVQAEGVVRDEGTRDAYVDLRGGPMGVAAQQITLEDLGVEQTKANIDRTRGLTDALDTQVELIKRPPVDTTIPGNANIAKEIKAISSEIASLENEETKVKDPNDEDKYLNIKDFFIYDDYKQEYVVNEKLEKKLSPRLEGQFDALRLAYDKQTQLRMNELVPIDLKQKDGSSKTEFVPRREYLRLLKLKDEADAKAAEEARQNEIIRRSNKINRDPYMQQPEVGGMGFPFSP